MQNPLMHLAGTAPELAEVRAEQPAEAINSLIEQLNADLADLKKIPAGERTFDNTMREADRIFARLGDLFGFAELLFNTSPDEAVRDALEAGIMQLDAFANSLGMDIDLYRATAEFAETPEAAALQGSEAKFLRDSLRDFRKNGLNLPENERAEITKIKDELSRTTTVFAKNIAEYKDELLVNEEDAAGLPADFLEPRRTENGQYRITMDYPDFRPFMQLCESEPARKELYFKFMNRAKDNNLPLLDEILALRSELAGRLGFPNFAAYKQAGMMADNPKTVRAFEEDLQEKIRPKAVADLKELTDFKKAKTGSDEKVKPWESAYYNNLLLKEKYEVDHEKIKEYFSLDRLVQGAFDVASQLFGMTFQEVSGPSVWHEDVTLYEVRNEKGLVGRLYFDPFPRENKYGHAACFPLVSGRQAAGGYICPTAAMVCNFPKPSPGRPSLLRHDDVETYFHEFGHALHVLLTVSPLASQAGTNTTWDFVEVPSQLFENWTWDYESLQKFALHYETGEVLPEELFQKMLAAKNFGSGLHILQQIFYGTYDMNLHEKYTKNTDTTEVLRQTQNEILLSPHTEGTYFQAAFGHLTGYAASYYGYLWSLVYAQDVFSVFREEGVFNAETGRKLLKTLLSKGGSQDEAEQLEAFLGRAPRAEAFLKSVGL